MASRSINKVMIMGNLVRDPELRYTAKGTPLCTFTVATNRDWKPNDSNEVREETEYHNVVAWSKLGELCAELLYKGRRVYIEGRLQTRDWMDEQSNKKMYRTEIVAEEMIALGAPKDGGSIEENAKEKKESLPSDNQEVQLREENQVVDSPTEDIPF